LIDNFLFLFLSSFDFIIFRSILYVNLINKFSYFKMIFFVRSLNITIAKFILILL